MHLLPCPSCQASLPVSPSQAGDQTKCPQCDAIVDIPNLGELRQLPLAEQPDSDASSKRAKSTQSDSSLLRRAGFVIFGLIATVSLLIAGFCGIRWSLVDVPTDTDGHVEILSKQYDGLTAAELIREYEQMERVNLELTVPYQYKKLQVTKSRWGRSGSIAGGIAAIAILAALALALPGRGSTSVQIRD